MGDYEAVLGEVRRSDMMRGIWPFYVSASPYAEGVDFEEAVDSAIELARLSELDDLDWWRREAPHRANTRRLRYRHLSDPLNHPFSRHPLRTPVETREWLKEQPAISRIN